MVVKNELKDIVLKEKKFLITTHISPDGDGIGSALALKRGLDLLGKKAIIVNHSKTPRNLLFLLKDDKEILEIESIDESFNPADFFTIVVDMGCFERLGKVYELIKKTRGILVIDHHIVQIGKDVYSLVDTSASATGEVVFDFLTNIGVEITKEIAEPLYTAIETDTGGFRFKGTTPKTHIVVSKLLQTGVEASYIFSQLYENEKLVRLKLMGEVFSTVSLYDGGAVATMDLRQTMLQKLNAKIEDGDDLVNYLMMLGGVQIGLYFKEMSDNLTKVSCRSRGEINLDSFLSKWGGGGHPQAAGLLMKEGIDKTKSIILSEISKILKNGKK